jgi:hypothetical protein
LISAERPNAVPVQQDGLRRTRINLTDGGVDAFSLGKIVACLSKEDPDVLAATRDDIEALMLEVWGTKKVIDVIKGLPQSLVTECGDKSVFEAGLGPFIHSSLSPNPEDRTSALSVFIEVRADIANCVRGASAGDSR